MTSSLTCHACGAEQVVASGAVALNMTPEKLARIGRKIGWEIEWTEGQVGKCFCPKCVIQMSGD